MAPVSHWHQRLLHLALTSAALLTTAAAAQAAALGVGDKLAANTTDRMIIKYRAGSAAALRADLMTMARAHEQRRGQWRCGFGGLQQQRQRHHKLPGWGDTQQRGGWAVTA